MLKMVQAREDIARLMRDECSELARRVKEVPLFSVLSLSLSSSLPPSPLSLTLSGCVSAYNTPCARALFDLLPFNLP